MTRASGDALDGDMPLEDLLTYLRDPQDLELTPYADLLNRMEAIGDPAVPSKEQTAVLRWVGEAAHYYEQRFPIEEPLASTIRRLKPLAAAMALTDPDFMQPDVHPLHQLLDCIQERAVGWQARLGRVGSNLEKQILAAVEEALQWFDEPNTNLAGICADFIEASERDKERALRMSSRVIDTERGKAKNAAAKRDAAIALNTLLEKYPAPLQIGDFIKGAWYDSAQLVLLKFGANSEQWSSMRKTTEALLDSVQSIEKASPQKRESIVAIVRSLPKELRQWLLSIHHDTQAVNDAMARIESVHLHLLRKDPIEITWIPPIPTTQSTPALQDTSLVKAMKPVVEWHWFKIETYTDGDLRVQLVLKDESTQTLVFVNLAGMKTATYTFAEFDGLMRQKRITALPHGSGFSLCLALSARIDTVEKLDELYTSVAARTQSAEAQQSAAEAPAEAADAPPAAAEQEESLADVLEKFARGDYENDEGPAAASVTALPDSRAQEQSPVAAAPAREEPAAFEDDDIFDSEDIIGDPNRFIQRDTEQAPPSDIDLSEAFRASAKEPGNVYFGGDSDEAPADDPLLSREELQGLESLIDDKAPRKAPPASYYSDEPERTFGRDDAPTGRSRQESPPVPPREAAASAPHLNIASASGLHLELGNWLSFKDGGAPVLAQLEFHEPGNDSFHFVNEEGNKLLVLPGTELKSMLDQGLVEVVQSGAK